MDQDIFAELQTLFTISQNKNIIILLWILRTSNTNVKDSVKESETLGWKDFKYHFVLAPSAQAARDTARWSMTSLSG